MIKPLHYARIMARAPAAIIEKRNGSVRRVAGFVGSKNVPLEFIVACRLQSCSNTAQYKYQRMLITY